MSLKDGFIRNVMNIESGTMTTLEGDSAQLIFVGRAILAGFNCSNVDVRSSRYDAVIDFEGRVLRIQVKGFSGGTISFKDRTRGGQGIDTSHQRNKGKRITSRDCDIFVALEKHFGLCYLFPMRWVDQLSEKQVKSYPVSQLSKYLERWEVIREVGAQFN